MGIWSEVSKGGARFRYARLTITPAASVRMVTGSAGPVKAAVLQGVEGGDQPP